MDNPYLNQFEEYLNWFKSLSEDESKRVAKESLIRSGVLNPDGTVKTQIVTSPHFFN